MKIAGAAKPAIWSGTETAGPRWAALAAASSAAVTVKAAAHAVVGTTLILRDTGFSHSSRGARQRAMPRADRTASGYDLMKLFDSSLADVWPASQSQVYGELGKLSGAGLLKVAYLSLEAARASAEHDELEGLDASLDRGDDRIPVYGRLALEYGLRLTGMRQEWAEWAREQVADRVEPR